MNCISCFVALSNPIQSILYVKYEVAENKNVFVEVTFHSKVNKPHFVFVILFAVTYHNESEFKVFPKIVKLSCSLYGKTTH